MRFCSCLELDENYYTEELLRRKEHLQLKFSGSKGSALLASTLETLVVSYHWNGVKFCFLPPILISYSDWIASFYLMYNQKYRTRGSKYVSGDEYILRFYSPLFIASLRSEGLCGWTQIRSQRFLCAVNGHWFSLNNTKLWLVLLWLVRKRGSINLRPAQVHAGAEEQSVAVFQELSCLAQRTVQGENHHRSKQCQDSGSVPFLDIQKRLLELKAARVSRASGATNAKL